MHTIFGASWIGRGFKLWKEAEHSACTPIQPLISASMQADCLGMPMKSMVLQFLGRFQNQGIVVEVTHRTAHHLFDLAGMALE